MKIMIVVGTRPEIIKTVSFYKECKTNKNIEVVYVCTGQHRDMSKKMLETFNITPDYDLNIMTETQTLFEIGENIFRNLPYIILKEKPDIITVVGDTATSFYGALTAYYMKTKILHIEAGVRTYNKYNAFPEEGYRRMIDHIADLNICQNISDETKLFKEGLNNYRFAGNTSLDLLKGIPISKQKIVLITAHRREGWGQPIEEVCDALITLSSIFKDYTFKFVTHPNPVIHKAIENKLSSINNIELIENRGFYEFIHLMASSSLIMTDSGGMVQEAIFFKKPIIYLREKSEYSSLFDGKLLVETDKNKKKIIEETKRILNLKSYKYPNIIEFGDGNAGKTIIETLLGELNGKN